MAPKRKGYQLNVPRWQFEMAHMLGGIISGKEKPIDLYAWIKKQQDAGFRFFRYLTTPEGDTIAGYIGPTDNRERRLPQEDQEIFVLHNSIIYQCLESSAKREELRLPFVKPGRKNSKSGVASYWRPALSKSWDRDRRRGEEYALNFFQGFQEPSNILLWRILNDMHSRQKHGSLMDDGCAHGFIDIILDLARLAASDERALAHVAKERSESWERSRLPLVEGGESLQRQEGRVRRRKNK